MYLGSYNIFYFSYPTKEHYGFLRQTFFIFLSCKSSLRFLIILIIKMYRHYLFTQFIHLLITDVMVWGLLFWQFSSLLFYQDLVVFWIILLLSSKFLNYIILELYLPSIPQLYPMLIFVTWISKIFIDQKTTELLSEVPWKMYWIFLNFHCSGNSGNKTIFSWLHQHWK